VRGAAYCSLPHPQTRLFRWETWLACGRLNACHPRTRLVRERGRLIAVVMNGGSSPERAVSTVQMKLLLHPHSEARLSHKRCDQWSCVRSVPRNCACVNRLKLAALIPDHKVQYVWTYLNSAAAPVCQLSRVWISYQPALSLICGTQDFQFFARFPPRAALFTWPRPIRWFRVGFRVVARLLASSPGCRFSNADRAPWPNMGVDQLLAAQPPYLAVASFCDGTDSSYQLHA